MPFHAAPKNTLKLQGFWCHTPGEQAELAIADIKALATLVGDKAFVLVFAFVASFLTPVFEMPIRTAAERHANLRPPRPDPAALFRRIERGSVCPFFA